MQKSRRFWCQGNPVSAQAFGGFASVAIAGIWIQDPVAFSGQKPRGCD